MTSQPEEQLVWRALNELAKEDSSWARNVSIYRTWSHDQRLWYIERIKVQAKHEIPAAVKLITKVVELRLRGANGI